MFKRVKFETFQYLIFIEKVSYRSMTKHFFLTLHIMKKDALLDASLKGDLNLVKSLLSSKNIDVNYANIFIYKYSYNLIILFQIKFKFIIFFKIYFNHLILQL